MWQWPRSERALDLLERAIAIDSRTGFAYLYLGYLYMQRGRVEQALVFIDRSATLLPEDRETEVEIELLRRMALADTDYILENQ